ncbi:MAG: hypothetical protein Q4A56_01105 [Porphyromonadaceae bacterium]|nr:hypothetical protein [Porphyromonadaceae bacterium]
MNIIFFELIIVHKEQTSVRGLPNKYFNKFSGNLRLIKFASKLVTLLLILLFSQVGYAKVPPSPNLPIKFKIGKDITLSIYDYKYVIDYELPKYRIAEVAVSKSNLTGTINRLYKIF